MKHSGPHRMWGSCIAKRTAAVLLAAVSVTHAASAQTDYYNTDAGRPLTIEDASATERYAFELQLAPLTLERTRGGVYRWEVEPEIAYGVLPRTQLEIGFPLSYLDRGGSSRRFGLNGIDLGVLHNLNVETSIPALAIAGVVLLPIGGFAPDEAVFTAKGIATRTLRFVRVHFNGQYSWALDERSDLSRWLHGVSVDRAFPLKSMLVGAEVFARKSMNGGQVQWNTAVGMRRQLSPTFNVDAGVGKQLNGNDRSWFATFGLAHAFAVRSLLPGR